MFETADLCNQRPIGVNKTPAADGSFDILTPNCLLMGRATSTPPDDTMLLSHLKTNERYLLIQQVTKDFWKHWTSEVTPLKVIRQKWHATHRNLAVGDVVLVHDESHIKGKYKLALVDSVKLSSDGLVCSCIVNYRIPSSSDSVCKYSGGKLIKLSRSIQRLSLILAVEEREENMVVEDSGVVKIVKDSGQSNQKGVVKE